LTGSTDADATSSTPALDAAVSARARQGERIASIASHVAEASRKRAWIYSSARKRETKTTS